ncbi:MAG: hypothetical protein ABSD62_03000 [Candidatus Limnocylindrales bacterium]
MLADGAEAVNGKIYIIGGGVERHLAPAFPAALRADIAVGILVDWSETNQRQALKIRIADEDGKPIATIEAEFEAGRPPGAKPGQDFRTLMAIKGPIPIPRAGAYKIQLELNGVEQDPPFRFWVDHLDLVPATAPPA